MTSIKRLIGRLSLSDLPMAWLQLKRQPVRYLVAVVGIGFAALLMYMQIGFQSGLLTSATTFYEALNTDLVLISPGTLNSGSFEQFPQSLLFRSLGVGGVKEAIPLYIANISAQRLGDIKPTNLRLIGFAPDDKALDLPAVNDQISLIKTPGYVLFDELGNNNTGPISEAVESNGSQFLSLIDLSKNFSRRRPLQAWIHICR